MISRRDIFAGLISMPCTLEVFAAPAEQSKAAAQQPILGPAVFEWEDMKPVKNATGEVRSLCKAPTATLELLEMHVSTLNAGQTSHPPHRHINEELIILREGECETLSNGKWIKVTPGSVVFNASNSLHGFRNIGNSPAVYHVVNWKPRGLEEERA
jgi:quercetin dioxygenase-like cupin family protein